MLLRLTQPSIDDEACAAVERVLRSGQLVHGPECEAFEAELAAYLGCREVALVSSGTAALHLSLLALGLGPGDAVIVPDFTFPATANAVELTGARPVFADVDAHTYNLTVDSILAAVEAWRGPEKIRVIVPVHEFGCPAPMPQILAIAQAYDWLVVEDAACALGTRLEGRLVGSFGQAGCFSFHPRKALTTGEGGAVATNDATLAKRIRSLRNHGMAAVPEGIAFVTAGFNYRMTNFQAAMGRTQLPKFDAWLAERRRLQALYRRWLADLPVVLPADVPGHAWQTFMIVLPQHVNRRTIIERLRDRQIEVNLGAQCLHRLAYYREKYPADAAALAGNHAERLYDHGLALPLYPGMRDGDVQRVAEELARTLEAAT